MITRCSSTWSVLLAMFLFVGGCGEDSGETMSKDEAREAAKADASFDYCDAFGWYGDGVCDDFCLVPDPDCEAKSCTQSGQCTATAVIIDKSGDGQTFDVPLGEDVVVRLPANPSTGYTWEVSSTDRSFAYPELENYLPDGGGAGSGGTVELVWRTGGPLLAGGESHTVELAYRRPWETEEEAADGFTFTIHLVDDQPANVVIGEEDDGGTFEVTEGFDVVVRLPSNPSTGYAWEVAVTNRTFGYPSSDEYIPDEGGPGTGGIQELTWKTDGFLSLVGTHTVELAYRRSWEEDTPPEKTFSFTVIVLEKD